MAQSYRSDIDGLRAVAVVPVILFHLGESLLPGGFVGVDIFFVISGFLITRLIIADVDRNRFSIAEFYRRRIRRIFPNLFAMLAVTTIAAALILLPYDFKVYGESLVATTLSAGNIFFWLKGGYFDVQAADMPLLHTWSLGVEEQYYIAFPLIVLLIARIRRSLLPLTLLLCFAASLALAVYQVATAPNAAFYLPFGRWWELMVGSMLAVGMLPPLKRTAPAEAVALAGAAMIVASLIWLSPQTPFPGLAALPPCLGAALIIYANSTHMTRVGRVLSLKPMVAIGLVSYSLYLWHWPVIVLSRYVLQRQLEGIDHVVALIVIVALALAAWQFIEKPLRRPRAETGSPLGNPFVAASIASALLVATGLAFWIAKGVPQRYPDRFQPMLQAAEDINPRRAECEGLSPQRILNDQICRIGDASQPVTFAVIGDSLVDAFMPALEKAAQEAGRRGILITRGGCLALAGIGVSGSECRRSNDAAFARIANDPNIESVLLMDRWAGFIEGERFGLHKSFIPYPIDDETTGHDRASGHATIERGLARTTHQLQGKTVWVAAFFPEQEMVAPRAVVIRSIIGGSLDGVNKSVVERRNAGSRELLKGASTELGFNLIDLSATFCQQTHCALAADGQPLYVDDNHPTSAAAIASRRVFAPFFAEPIAVR